MLKKISIFVLLGVVFTGLLYYYYNRNAIEDNGFKRLFILHPQIAIKQTYKLESDSFSISEVNYKNVILFKYRKPFDHTIISFETGKKQSYTLPVGMLRREDFNGSNSISTVDKSFFLLVGNNGNAYQISPALNKVQKYRIDTTSFQQSQTIDSTRFMTTKAYLANGFGRRTLNLIDIAGKELRSYTPRMQVDGYYCTAGVFQYDNPSKRVFYMYYYRGEVDCLDSNLKFLSRIKTIDTITTADIKISKLQYRVTVKTPQSVVNKRFCVFGDKLYLNSGVRADNETQFTFSNHQVFDIYNIKSGKYLKSFYLPRRVERNILAEFKVIENRLVALYDNVLVVFEIPN